jgi:hypothetical protein
MMGQRFGIVRGCCVAIDKDPGGLAAAIHEQQPDVRTLVHFFV